MDALDVTPWRKLVVIWHYAPFGPVKFPVWLWRYATLKRKTRAIQVAAAELDDPDVDFVAGTEVARLYCQLFPIHVVYAAAEKKVEMVGEGVTGRPVDVGFFLYLHHHPKRQR